MPNAQNVAILENVKNDLQDSSALWIVDYRGLTVKSVSDLRVRIRNAGAEMKVYKNTLMRIGLAQCDQPNLDPYLEGPSAFIFVKEDPVASAKVIKDFAAENPLLEIKGGMMDGQAVDAAQVIAIASLPSREELIAKLLGTISNPMVGIVRVLNGPMEAFARCVSAIADQKGEAA